MTTPNQSSLRGSSPYMSRIGSDAEPANDPKVNGQCQFELYREDQSEGSPDVISGGMWRWRLCSSSGGVLARSGSYETDTECLSAIAALRNFAASARLIRQG